MSGFHLLSNLWLDSKNEWCRETTGRASNINIRLAKHSHLSVREEPQHTNTCRTNPAGQTALGRSPAREEPQHTNTCGTNPAGQTALGRSPAREETQHTNTCGTNPAGQGGDATHKHMRNQPCRPDRTRQVAGQGGAATHTHATNSAGQTAFGRSPVREELQHICMWPILLMRPHSKCVYSTSSPLWMQSLSKHYKMPQVYPEVIEWSDKKRMVRETKELFNRQTTSCQQ